MKKILFIPTYTYLSTPIFTRLLVELKEYETIYLDVEDQYQCEKTSEQFKNKFIKSINLHINADSLTLTDKVIKFFKMIRFQEKLKKTIKQEAPVAIVTTGDLTFSIRIIKKYFPNIPIFVIQSALFTNKNIPRKYSQDIAYILLNKVLRVPIVSKQNYFGEEFKDIHLLMWGESFKRMLSNKKNIHIVGDITFDNFPIKKDKKEKKIFLAKQGFALDAKVVIICTSVLESLTTKETINTLHSIYQKLIINRKDLFFIIKPHPRNNTKELRAVFESLKVNNCMIQDINLHLLFKYADIHISTFSRTAIEAIASEIPVISVNPNNEINLQDFLNNELNEKVTNLQEMYDKIDDIINKKDDYLSLGEHYIKDKLYKLDANAAKRATTIIEKEIKS